MSDKSKPITNEEIRKRMRLAEERKRLLASIEEDIVMRLCEAGVTVGEAKRMMESIIDTIAYCSGRICMIDAMRDEYEDMRTERDGSAPLPDKTLPDVVNALE